MFLFLYLCIFIFSVLYQTRSSKNDWRNVCIYIKNHVERKERGEININKSRNGNQSEVYKRVLHRQRPIFYKTNSNRESNFMLKELRFPFESPFSKSPAENNVNKTRSAQEEKTSTYSLQNGFVSETQRDTKFVSFTCSKKSGWPCFSSIVLLVLTPIPLCCIIFVLLKESHALFYSLFSVAVLICP